MVNVITVVGNVAAGKSTLLPKLHSTLNGVLLHADEFYKESPFLPLEIKDRKRWSLTGDLWFLQKRFEMLHRALQTESEIILVDSGLAMNYVYAFSRLLMGYYTDDEWSLYKALHRELNFPKDVPQSIVYLHCPTDLLMERIKRRGRDFEVQNYTRSYLLQLEKSLEHSIQEWKQEGIQIIEIDASKKVHVDEIVLQIKTALDPLQMT